MGMQLWAGTQERVIAKRARAGQQPGNQQGRNSSQAARRAGAQIEATVRAAPVAVAAHIRDNPNTDLLAATAQLALATARQVQQLSGISVRTVTMPDAAAAGPALRALAEIERPWSEEDGIYVWAHAI